jgi:hypothetical protein
MVLDERARHELYLRLEAALGTEAADTMMEHPPPVGWADVATKRDLDALEERMDLRLDSMKFELLATFRGELHGAVSAQTKTLTLTLFGAMLTTSGLAFAAARLAG